MTASGEHDRRPSRAARLRSFLTLGVTTTLALAACGKPAADNALSVEDFIAQIDRLDGQTVSVTGYLGECNAHSCMLYPNKAESVDVDRAMADIRAALDDGSSDVSHMPFPEHPSISIGPGSPWSFFEFRAYFPEGSHVIVSGEASSKCLSGERMCFDRAGDLYPESIHSTSVSSYRTAIRK